MKQYRIKEIVFTNGLGKSEVNYRLEKKFLWFWIGATHQVLGRQCNEGLEINRYSSYFANIDHAKIILEYLKNPYQEYYKGKKLEKIMYDFDIFYININSIRSCGKYRGFYADYSKNIETLKRNIDEKIIKTTESIINL